MMIWLRALGKALRALVHVLSGYATIRLRFPNLSEAEQQARVQAWARRMLVLLEVELVIRGTPAATGPMLLVANHISWLDILVIHASRYCRFVSKAEVHHWPLIGTLATGAGTLYIEREQRRDAMRVVHHVKESLMNGEVVGVFPEGTTTDGRGLLPFHANMMQAAISAQAPVQPVALQFVDSSTGQYSPAANYIDDDTLVGSLWCLLTAPRLSAIVHFGAPDTAAGRDRRTWAADLRAQVEHLLTSA